MSFSATANEPESSVDRRRHKFQRENALVGEPGAEVPHGAPVTFGFGFADEHGDVRSACAVV